MTVVIKRYRNRKLYNTQLKRYITLNEIEGLIKQQEAVKVIENDSGNDITAATLSQIIFEHEKNETGLLPINLLTSLVQSGGKRMEEIRRNIFNSLTLAHHFDAEIERRVDILISRGELSQEEASQVLKKLLSVVYTPDDMRENIEERIISFLREKQLPSHTDFQTLIDRVESLEKKVDVFNSMEKSQDDGKEDRF
jgi:polyhydroxyalkanoate synthesis repressor PhaR